MNPLGFRRHPDAIGARCKPRDVGAVPVLIAVERLRTSDGEGRQLRCNGDCRGKAKTIESENGFRPTSLLWYA